MQCDPNKIRDPKGGATVDAPPSSSIQTLLGLLTAQRDLYARMAELSSQHAPSLREASSDRLLRVVSARHELSAQAAALHRQLAPLIARWPVDRQHATAEDRQAVHRMTSEVRELLNSILRQDATDQGSLRLRPPTARPVSASLVRRAYGQAG